MKLFAVTYTDPSEPWGAAVLDGTLYRTPSAVCDAANAHFDAWQSRLLYRDSNETLRSYYLKELNGPCGGHYRHYGRETGERDRQMTVDEVLADAWSREFGFACYTVKD